MNANQLIVYMQRSPVFAQLVLSVLTDARDISLAIAAPREKAFGTADGDHLKIGMLAGRADAVFHQVELAERLGQGAPQ